VRIMPVQVWRAGWIRRRPRRELSGADSARSTIAPGVELNRLFAIKSPPFGLFDATDISGGRGLRILCRPARGLGRRSGDHALSSHRSHFLKFPRHRFETGNPDEASHRGCMSLQRVSTKYHSRIVSPGGSAARCRRPNGCAVEEAIDRYFVYLPQSFMGIVWQ
jgi:hypothetical protein